MLSSVGRAGALRLVERTSRRLPVTVPASIGNAYHRRTHADDFDGYDHPPDPFAVLAVDPSRIEAFTGRPYPPYHDKRDRLGTVREGEWDRRDEAPIVDDDYRERYDLYRADRFAESCFYESLRAHFEDGIDWTATPFVRRCLELADRGEQSWRSMTSREAILERCRRIDELYERIRTEGYRSQRELGERSVLRVTDEVLVDIGRDGTPLFVNGRHRLAIAKLLDLDSIPVGVLVRHADWMTTREAYARGERAVESVPSDHPDLRDIAGSSSNG